MRYVSSIYSKNLRDQVKEVHRVRMLPIHTQKKRVRMLPTHNDTWNSHGRLSRWAGFLAPNSGFPLGSSWALVSTTGLTAEPEDVRDWSVHLIAGDTHGSFAEKGSLAARHPPDAWRFHRFVLKFLCKMDQVVRYTRRDTPEEGTLGKKNL